MNNEFKYTLIENEYEYKNKLINEISEISDENELMKYLDKIISIQYYKGLFYDNTEYDEILSDKINEIINIEIENSVYSNNEFKYFIKSLLEYYDIYLTGLKFSIEIDLSIKIKSEYLISILDSEIFLDEIDSDYLDEIIIYEDIDSLIYSIQDIYEIKSNNYLLDNYIDYNSFISDSDEYIEYEYLYETRYIENCNNY